MIPGAVIRPAGPEDSRLIRALSSRTFIETYGAYNSQENIRQYLSCHFSPEHLSAEMLEKDSWFLLIFFGETAAGYARLCSGEIPESIAHRKAIQIGRIYILKSFQGLKLGGLLMDFLLATAGQKGFDVLWLGVWEKNHSAIGFYRRKGFEIFGQQPFLLGTAVQNDYLMKREIAAP